MSSDASLLDVRLSWLEQRIDTCNTRVAVSYNLSNDTQKVKFVLHNSCNNASGVQSCAVNMVDMLKRMTHTHCIVDKGHRSKSKDISFVEFWIRKPYSDHAAGGEKHIDVPPPPPAPPMLQDISKVQYDAPLAATANYIPGKLHDIERLCANIATVCSSSYSDQCDQRQSWQALCELQNHNITNLYAQLRDQRNIGASHGDSNESVMHNLEEAPNKLDKQGSVSASIASRDSDDYMRLLAAVRDMDRGFIEFGRALQNTHVDLKAGIEKLDVARCQDTLWQQYAQTHITLSSIRNEIIQSLDSAVNNLRDEILVSLVKGGTKGVATQTDQVVVATLANSYTQCTASMIEDEYASTGVVDSDGMVVRDEASESEEDLIPVHQSELQDDAFYMRQIRVHDEGRMLLGQVVGINRGLQSGDTVYRILYDDGDMEDFSREQVEGCLI